MKEKFFKISVLKNKYVIASLVFLLWLCFFDQNSLIETRQISTDLQKLKAEKHYYIEKLDEDRKKIDELKTNKKNLEKFAREQYFMKKPNEDIFVIVEEEN
jgi:cell division protein FtsB